MSEQRVHLEWLGYAQPTGLVVTAPALASAGAWPDKNVAARQEHLKAIVGEHRQLKDLQAFLEEFLRWQRGDFRPPGESDQLYLEEYKDTLKPDAVVTSVEGQRIAYIQQVPNGVALDELPPEGEGWHASVETRFERLLRDTGVSMGVLSNGKTLRLVYAPKGESAGHLTFDFTALCEVAGRPLLSALVMLLDADRVFMVPRDKRLPAILADSRRYQTEVSTLLSEQVLEALHLLVRGFETADGLSRDRLLQELRRAEHRRELSDGLLTVVLRLVFLLYAEDKGLMPQSTVYVSSYSVTGLFEQLRDDEARYPETMHQRFGAWARLVTLFRLVFRGGQSGDFKLPKRHGALFDPDRFPFLEGRARGDHFSSDRAVKLRALPRVSDGTVLGVLRNLLVLNGERLSYRALDVEQIGSVYESMMGFELEEAEGRVVALRPAHVMVNLDALLAKKGKARLEALKEEAGAELSGNAAKAVQAADSVEDLVAALERRLSPFTKQPLPKGSLYLQPGRERRRSGSHYTPRSLTEPIVRTTLEPMLKGLGPNPLPRQIVGLKVCDPAMGSGAFLVEACRYLGKALEESWSRHRMTPPVPPDEDVALHAQRVVAQKCLYGVDKNEMAVQLAKLSLWLFTLAKDHPFTFLDHALKCGDSLVGLSRTQVQRMSWDEAAFTQVFNTHMERLVERGEVMRLQIHDLPDPPDTAELKVLNEAAEQSLETARLIGNLTVAAWFHGGNAKAKKDRLQKLATKVQLLFTEHLGNRSAVRDDGMAPELATLNVQLRALWESLRDEVAHVPARPFHWELEFPEVFGKGRDGFDAFVGNPPFSGKNGISEAGGDEYIPWLQLIHEGAHGNADLSAHFFRRAFGLLCDHGTFGLISTNTIAQGDTRATGLQPIVKTGGTIYCATRSMMWPGNAAVAVSVVHVAKGRDREAVAWRKVLDGKVVPDINSRLRGKPERPDPVPLKANENLSFQGTIVLGMGFVLTPEERDEYVKKDKRNAERIFPYIGGEEVNSSPTQDFNRYVICFSELPKKAGEKFRSLSEEEAKKWPDLYGRLRELVRLERAKNNRQVYRDNWWLFAEQRPALYETRAGLERCLVRSLTSKHACYVFQSSSRVLDQTLITFLSENLSSFAELQSRIHEIWRGSEGASMKEDPRYNIGRCFDPFPFVVHFRQQTADLEDIGKRLYDARAKYMKEKGQGLTATYNELKDAACQSAEVVALRKLHEELDRKVLEAYGWSDIAVPPYTTPETDAERAAHEAFEDEVLDRLFALNARRASLESVSGPSPQPPKKPSAKKGKRSKNQPALDLESGD
ncbi:MAG: Eco57I restriction-modification methylase domain-containing protein [Myxococcota bacterium]